jgi:hypothetical protein
MQTVQLSLADGRYAAAVREALSRSCAWHVESAGSPDATQQCVLVLDESAFEKLPLPLSNPERIVLIARKNPRVLAEAWEAGIVSVISADDPISTVLLAIMAAALRVANFHASANAGEISPTSSSDAAPISPPKQSSGLRRCKTQ